MFRWAACLVLWLALVPAAGASSVAARALTIDGIDNLRDLGGLEVAGGRRLKHGKLYRSAALTGARSQSLLELSDQLEIRTLIDFRSKAETRLAPERALAGAQKLSLPVSGAAAEFAARLSGPDAGNGLVSRATLQSRFTTGFSRLPLEGVGAYRAMFDALLKGDAGAALLHCQYGTDRTGVAVILLLTALEVPEEAIRADFLASNDYLDRDAALSRILARVGQRSTARVTKSDLMPLVSVSDAQYDAMTQAVTARYGSLDSYLRLALGIDAAKRARLQALYTEPLKGE